MGKPQTGASRRLESEAEFVETENTDERLLALLGRAPSCVSAQPKPTPGANDQKKPEKRKPGNRVEGHDPTDQEPDDGTMSGEISEEQAAG